MATPREPDVFITLPGWDEWDKWCIDRYPGGKAIKEECPPRLLTPEQFAEWLRLHSKH